VPSQAATEKEHDVRKRILVAVGVVAVVAAVAVPVMVAAATPSPTVKPAVTAKPVTVADDHGGLTKAKSKDDPVSRWSS
jgi:hypothetical protein